MKVFYLGFANKHDGSIISACVCYAPPEHSTRAIKVVELLDTLLTQIHSFQQDGHIWLCGDFNSRLGDRLDYIDDIDEVPDRHVLDLARNAYGELFSEFLQNVNLCVLNGHNTTWNDYTSVRRQGGMAVVDYCAVPYELLHLFSNFEVIRASTLFEACGCLGVSDPTHSISDHSVLKWTMKVPPCLWTQADVPRYKSTPVNLTNYDVRIFPLLS